MCEKLTAEANLRGIKDFFHDKEKKFELCSELGSNGWNAIHVAVLKENEEIILYFLDKSKEHFLREFLRDSNFYELLTFLRLFPLYFLSLFSFRKADFNNASTSGWTPLILSIFQNNIEIMKMLLSLAPINVNSITLKGTALNVACKKACKDNQKLMIKFLINADANP